MIFKKDGEIKLPAVVVWNGPALIRITLMRIQCGRMQHALLRIVMLSVTSADRPLVSKSCSCPHCQGTCHPLNFLPLTIVSLLFCAHSSEPEIKNTLQ